MPKYNAKVVWTVMGDVTVEAKNESEALDKVYAASLPTGGIEYLEYSFDVDVIEEIPENLP